MDHALLTLGSCSSQSTTSFSPLPLVTGEYLSQFPSTLLASFWTLLFHFLRAHLLCWGLFAFCILCFLSKLSSCVLADLVRISYCLLAALILSISRGLFFKPILRIPKEKDGRREHVKAHKHKTVTKCFCPMVKENLPYKEIQR